MNNERCLSSRCWNSRYAYPSSFPMRHETVQVASLLVELTLPILERVAEASYHRKDPNRHDTWPDPKVGS